MAKVKSTAAANAIMGRAGGMIYYQMKGRGAVTYARGVPEHVAQPRTVGQVSVRALMRGMARLWREMAPGEREYWKGDEDDGLCAWVCFCAYNLRQSRAGWMPQIVRHAQPLGMPPPPTDLTATVRDRALVCTWTDVAGALTSGVHLLPTAETPATMRNLAACVAAAPGTMRQATIVVAAGRYYVVARSGAEDGGAGAASGAVGPVEMG